MSMRFTWNDDFILTKRKHAINTPDSEPLYYIVRVADGQVTGPLSESDFSDALEEQNIPLTDSDWVSVLNLKHQYE